jgi:hypothetical protein
MAIFYDQFGTLCAPNAAVFSTAKVKITAPILLQLEC